MAETLQVSAGTQLIDLKTGKLTPQGLYVFQVVSGVLDTLNTHEEVEADTSTLGHVLKGAAVTDGSASSVSVDSGDVSAAPASYDQAWGGEVEALANEAKADINTLVTNVNAINTQLNALLTSLETAGVIST